MVRVRMSMRDEFENAECLRAYLAQQLAKGRLTMVLGAGVSVEFGLPTWDQLLDKLYAKQEVDVPDNASLPRKAEYLRSAKFRDNPAGFVQAVKEVLYEEVCADFDVLHRNRTLAAIASIAMSSLRGSVAEVVTFNWDNLLELYLEYHGFVTHSITSRRCWGGHVDVTVVHPHGFIPYDDRPSSADIVLDQKSYSRIVGRADNPWSQRILTLLRGHTPLFIGLSGNDSNLDSLLVQAQEEHASIEESSVFWGVVFLRRPAEEQRSFWEERGIYAWALSTWTDLPEALFRVAQEAARQRRNES